MRLCVVFYPLPSVRKLCQNFGTMNLPLWIEFFDDLQHVRGRSLNTIMAYRRDLELFVEFKKTEKPLSGFY